MHVVFSKEYIYIAAIDSLQDCICILRHPTEACITDKAFMATIEHVQKNHFIYSLEINVHPAVSSS